MPLSEEEKIIICSADAVYLAARSIREVLDLMLLAVKSRPGREQAEQYDAEVRPHVEAMLAAAKRRGAGADDEEEYLPDSPAAV